MTLKLDEKRLTSFPLTSVQQSPKPPSTIIISRNRISEIKKEELQSVLSLTNLDASCNHLSEIPAIDVLTSIAGINFASNFISEFPKFTTTFSSLKKVDLSLNKLSSLPSEFFTQSPNIEELHAKYNSIQKIPDEIGKCIKLKKIDFSNNSLVSIPESLGNLQALTTLGLENNQIKVIPATLGGLKNLQIIQLGRNQIESLPSELKNLKKVHTFRLNQNKLKEVPVKLFSKDGLSKLKLVQLSHNQLTFKKAFGDLCSIETLKIIDLSHNLIEEIPEEISQLEESLEELHLQGNKIKTLPEGLFELDNLKHLNLSHNQIETIPPQVSGLSDVTTFLIGYNKLTSIPSEITDLTSLEEFVISGNPLIELPPVEKMIVLQTLYASSTEISKLPDESGIQFLYSLEKIDISHNPKLSVIPEVWSHIRENHSFTYDHTPVHPDYSSQEKTSTYRIGYSEMQGKRESMEDGMSTEGDLMDSVFYCGVFDGHGDSIASKYCAERLHQSIKVEIQALKTTNPDILKNIDEPANQALLTEKIVSVTLKLDDAMRPTVKRTGGTTAVFILIINSYLFSFNVGDSRAVLCHKDQSATRVSVDHKPFDIEERERVRSKGGYVTLEGRVNNNLAVSRSLGDYEMYPYVSNQPYVSVTKITPDHTGLILACDGLWDVVSDEEASQLFHQVGGDVWKAACILKDTAYVEGSEDNISVLVVALKNN